MSRSIASLLLVAALGLAGSGVFAADSAPVPAAPDSLSTARARIAEKNWAAAIEELKRVDETRSADWNNLMGYSLRKATPPDYAAAQRHYDAALAIDPKHRGALEYSGELYLIRGMLPEAEQRLATLDKLCFFPCEEYTDLKQAIGRYKAAGNRYVAP